MTRKELHDQAMALPPDERARLAHQIIASLDGPADKEAAEAWVREIERRVREVKNGSVKLVGWKDARSRILKRLSARKRFTPARGGGGTAAAGPPGPCGTGGRSSCCR